MLWASLTTAAALASVSHASHLDAVDGLNDTLASIINEYSGLYNVSLSVAFTFADPGSGETVTAAAAGGPVDHATGATATTDSLYPGGSVDKFFTAVSCMRLVEEGLLDLDTPVHTYIDAWNAKHSPPRPTLLETYGYGEINSVTTRQLLQMRAGLHDYNDSGIFHWTIMHPDEDYTPTMFIDSSPKEFLFPPGTGGAYSGNSFILAGMVMAAVSGAPTYDKLNQRSLAGYANGEPGPTFMGPGKCSTHPGVVHQYYYGDSPYGLDTTLAALRAAELGATATAAAAPPQGKCGVKPGGDGWYSGIQIVGSVLTNITLSGADATPEGCCAAAGAVRGARYWTFARSGLSNSTCEVYYRATSGKPSLHTSGAVDHPIVLSDFHDLYNDSCLNGWAMGNIAAAPKHVTEYYHRVVEGKLVSAESLRQMHEYKPLTSGTEPPKGTEYGLGLFKSNPRFALVDGADKSPLCKPPMCECDVPGKPCQFNVSSWGHAGLDWGSGFNFNIGYSPELNLSFALAFNSYLGMNTSMTYLDNHNSYMYSAALCASFSAVVQVLVPGFPAFACEGADAASGR